MNFKTNPQGDIDRLVVSLDENEATFIRKPDATLSDPKTLTLYTGKYEISSTIIEVILKNENQLFISVPGQPQIQLIPYKPGIFHTKEFADFTFEFVMENGKISGMK